MPTRSRRGWSGLPVPMERLRASGTRCQASAKVTSIGLAAGAVVGNRGSGLGFAASMRPVAR